MSDDLMKRLDNLWSMLEDEGYYTKANTVELARNSIKQLAASCEALTAERDALRAARVNVKPLVWYDLSCESFAAQSTFGDYVVELHDGDGWGMWTPDEGDLAPDAHSWHQTEEVAKAAAKADYEARILAALELTPDTSQIDAIRAALEAAIEKTALIPERIPADPRFAYHAALDAVEHHIRALDPAVIAAKLKGDGDDRA